MQQSNQYLVILIVTIHNDLKYKSSNWGWDLINIVKLGASKTKNEKSQETEMEHVEDWTTRLAAPAR